MIRRIIVCLVMAVLVVNFAQRSPAAEPGAETYLTGGKLADGEKALRARLERSPRDDSVRFALGGVQFLRALERLGQNLHAYGLRQQNFLGMNIVVLNLPFGKNPHPKTLTYEKARSIVQEWVTDLEAAEKTLAPITDPKVALPVQVDQITLDIGGDSGKPVRLIEVLAVTGLAPRTGGADQKPLLIRFDRADVAWLRAYCHLLSAIGDVVLAHDGRELFEHTAHLFFTNVDTPYAFLKTRGDNPEANAGWNMAEITDLIALIHLLRLPVVEPARMKEALRHLEQMIALSREMWKFALAETDDDHEWIPNPKQKGPYGVTIAQPLIDAWMKFLDEAEGLLAGRLLVPFWRDSTQGVNLRRVFTEPRNLDLVLWVQGTAAAPYLENGPKTSMDTWTRLTDVFQGNFFRFFVWVN
jgi:hypothetical protein